MSLSTIFYNPMQLPWHSLLWLLIPLVLVVAVIYKTIRLYDIRRLAGQSIRLFGYILGGLVALGVVTYLIVTYWP